MRNLSWILVIQAVPLHSYFRKHAPGLAAETDVSESCVFVSPCATKTGTADTRWGESGRDEEEREKPGAMKRLTSISLWGKKKKISATRQITSTKKNFHHRRRTAARGPGAAT